MAHKILIADDESMLTDLLSEHLQDSGYTTFIAHNSDEVIGNANQGLKKSIAEAAAIRPKT